MTLRERLDELGKMKGITKDEKGRYHAIVLSLFHWVRILQITTGEGANVVTKFLENEGKRYLDQRGELFSYWCISPQLN